jgi:hypothetical protein
MVLLVQPEPPDFRRRLEGSSRPVEAVYRVRLFRLAQVNPPEMPRACGSSRVELDRVCQLVKVEWPGRLQALGLRQLPVMPRLPPALSRPRLLEAEHS